MEIKRKLIKEKDGNKNNWKENGKESESENSRELKVGETQWKGRIVKGEGRIIKGRLVKIGKLRVEKLK